MFTHSCLFAVGSAHIFQVHLIEVYFSEAFLFDLSIVSILVEKEVADKYP